MTIPSDNAMVLETRRLVLTPMRAEHADMYYAVHQASGGPEWTLDVARAQCERASARQSPDGTEIWLNWIVTLRDGDTPVAHLQGEVVGRTGTMAWSTSLPHRNAGYATEAAGAVLKFIAGAFPVDRVTANIRDDNEASNRVATKLSMVPTDDRIDGEVVWAVDTPIGP